MTDIHELEADRIASLESAEIENPEDFAPGSFGCHEALHTTSLLMENVSAYLTEHPAILLDGDFYRLAMQAHQALFDLYQAIGEKHLASNSDDEA